MRTLAERVASLVARVPGSLKDFEAEHSIGNGTLQKIARGVTTKPSPQTLHRIASAFGVTVAWLMGEEAPASSSAPERTTELDDRYPTRREAKALLRGKVDPEVLEAISERDLEARTDPGLEYWVREIRLLAKTRKEFSIDTDVEVPIPPPKKR